MDNSGEMEPPYYGQHRNIWIYLWYPRKLYCPVRKVWTWKWGGWHIVGQTFNGSLFWPINFWETLHWEYDE